jgi:hypothetical protein
MSLDVPAKDAERIEEVIASAESPVGIDAKKTHVIIIQKLVAIERRLEKLEEQMKGRS